MVISQISFFTGRVDYKDELKHLYNNQARKPEKPKGETKFRGNICFAIENILDNLAFFPHKIYSEVYLHYNLLMFIFYHNRFWFFHISINILVWFLLYQFLLAEYDILQCTLSMLFLKLLSLSVLNTTMYLHVYDMY